MTSESKSDLDPWRGPEAGNTAAEIAAAVARILARRRGSHPVTFEEILSARDEGRR